MLAAKMAAVSALEEEVSTLQRELDRQKDVVEETQDCAARDLSQVVSKLNDRHQEQLGDLVSIWHFCSHTIPIRSKASCLQ